MIRIFLIGYMGAGKTTFGRCLATALNINFIDLDQYIEARYRLCISEIFSKYGEEKFREIEKTLLQEIAGFEDVIISTGGGTPCFFDNMTYMSRMGVTLYLKASPRQLVDRLLVAKVKRPLIEGKNENELLVFVAENLQKREMFYNQSSVIFETGTVRSKADIFNCTEQLLQTLRPYIS